MDICNCSICRNRIGKGESTIFWFLKIKISYADLCSLIFVNIFVKETKLLSFDENVFYLPDTVVSTVDICVQTIRDI